MCKRYDLNLALEKEGFPYEVYGPFFCDDQYPEDENLFDVLMSLTKPIEPCKGATINAEDIKEARYFVRLICPHRLKQFNKIINSYISEEV